MKTSLSAVKDSIGIQGSGKRDEIILWIAVIIYVTCRIALRSFLGKESRDKFFISHKLNFAKFLLCDTTIRYKGFRVKVRKGDPISIWRSTTSEAISEEYILPYLELDKNAVFIDVGANLGKYVLLASRKIKEGTIVAIEPDARTFETLNYNKKLNNITNTTCLNIALWSSPCTMNLYKGNDSGGNSLLTETREATTVRCETLDGVMEKLGLSRIDLLKIDAEGAEVEILKGAAESLHRTKTIIVETHFLKNDRLVQQMLAHDGFNLTVHPITDVGISEEQFCQISHVIGKR